MKKIILLIVLAFSFAVYSQEEIKEGTLKMKVTMSSENPQINSTYAMLGDLSSTTTFKGDKSRTEMSNPIMGTNISIVDNKNKVILVLMDNPMIGKKFMKTEIQPDIENLKKITVTETGEHKTILGYDCKGFLAEGENTKMTLYVTEKIKGTNQNIAPISDKIKGFPLLSIVEINQNGASITTTAEVMELNKEDVDDALFDMTIPEGYTELKMPGK